MKESAKGRFFKNLAYMRPLNLARNADSSTDTTVGWTKNTQKPNFFLITEKIIQNAKTQNGLEICQY